MTLQFWVLIQCFFGDASEFSDQIGLHGRYCGKKTSVSIDKLIMEKIYCYTALIICTMDLFTTLLISLLFAILIKWWIKGDPPKINGVYSQPNKWYWLKYAAFRLILWLRKRQQNRTVSGKSAGLGRKSRNSPEEMDRIQVLSDEHPTVSIVAS